VIGGATALASIYELGVVLVGAASGGATAVTDVAANAMNRKPTTWDDAKDIGFNTVTGGFGEYLPGVSGRLPSIFSRNFFTGSHAQASFAQNLAYAGVQLSISNSPSISFGAQLNALKSALLSASAVLNSLAGSRSSQNTSKSQ
jgi:hypothetical protein